MFICLKEDWDKKIKNPEDWEDFIDAGYWVTYNTQKHKLTVHKTMTKPKPFRKVLITTIIQEY